MAGIRMKRKKHSTLLPAHIPSTHTFSLSLSLSFSLSLFLSFSLADAVTSRTCFGRYDRKEERIEAATSLDISMLES
jgi:hypothetical protein